MIKNKIIDLLSELKGFKIVTTVVLLSKKIQRDDKTLYTTFHSDSIVEAIINESDIDGVFDLLLIEEEGKTHYVLIKDFNTYMSDLTLHRAENIFTVIIYKLLEKQKKLKCHFKGYFKINTKQNIKIPQKVNMLDSKIMKKNNKVSIYDLCRFQSTLVPEDNGKQNPN